MIFLGSDHAGYELKEKVKQWLIERGESVTDIGTDSPESVDYPQFAKLVGSAVKDRRGKGILFCRSGQGMAIAANKINGIRAAVAWIPEIAKEARTDSDSNVLVLPAGYLTFDQTQEIILAWLNTPFSSTERYLRRINQLSELEKQQ